MEAAGFRPRRCCRSLRLRKQSRGTRQTVPPGCGSQAFCEAVRSIHQLQPRYTQQRKPQWTRPSEQKFETARCGVRFGDVPTRCMEAAQAAYDEGQAMLDALNAQYDDIISWADMYDSASTESKKMIVSCLIRRVEVYRDYRLHIDFNIDFEQFSAGLDISAIAA